MISIKRYTINDPLLAEAGFAVRRSVFVDEQQVLPEEEFDGEEESVHFLLFFKDIPVATARWRITENGIKLERFAVLREYRKHGFGTLILNAVLTDLRGRKETIYLNAQVSALKFYERNGFVRCGSLFLECDIQHYKMVYKPHTIGSLTETIHQVYDFHAAFGIPNGSAPCLVSDKDFQLRYRLMQEENEEYLEACENGNLTEIADALGDQLYILCGTILRHGLQDKIHAIFREIHNSNMSKLDENGKPVMREDGKVLKSNRYFKPDIDNILSC